LVIGKEEPVPQIPLGKAGSRGGGNEQAVKRSPDKADDRP